MESKLGLAKAGHLVRAPHRLLFFVGACNLLLGMLWWAAWLGASRWQWFEWPEVDPYAGWLHAFVMQYQMLPSFVFGFLLTVFPRWMGQPDLDRWCYVPVGLGMFGGQLATLLGACGFAAGITVGVILTLGGWVAALLFLGGVLARDARGTWHARSCYAALLLGMVGLLGFAAFLLGADARWVFASIKIGSFGFLLPVFFTVAHRMFPFFAGNVVPGYVAWRPMWLLGLFWAGCIGHLALELVHAYAWLWLADLPLLALSTLALARWWPRGPSPGILKVLFWGLAWLPVALALYALQSIVYLLDGGFVLGRAPAHALFVGFFGSLLVAMVTRVTHGHSGRALRMSGVAWYAFAGIQVVAVLRIVAELARDVMAWQAVSAVGWLLVLAPWVAAIGVIYLSPRADGRPG